MQKNKENLDWGKIRNILTTAREKSKLTYIIDDCIADNKNISTLDLSETIALAILTAGYVPLKWHKIKDSDFPEDGKEVLAYYEDEEESSGYGCGIAYYMAETNSFYSSTIRYPATEKIAAWTDIPKYLEF